MAEQLTLLSKLHHAHARNEFFIDYQPIFDGDQHVTAVEALRWRKPNGEILRELQRLGFEISLDDFGMGYSSLSMLKRVTASS